MNGIRQLRALILLVIMAGCVGSSRFNSLTASDPSVACKLPSIQLSDLNGNDHVFPEEWSSSHAILVFGFAHAQRETVDAWFTALESSFPEIESIPHYKVAVIGSSNAILRTIIRNGMRAGTRSEDGRARLLTLFTDKEPFRAAIGVTGEAAAAVLFAPSGEVRSVFEGEPTPAAIANLQESLTKELEEDHNHER